MSRCRRGSFYWTDRSSKAPFPPRAAASPQPPLGDRGPRAPEALLGARAGIIQSLGTGSLTVLPAEAAFESPLAPAVDQYLSTDTANARDRARLFHLAWGVSCSAFAGRQVLYERMFGGNLVRNAMALFHTYDKEPSMT